MQIRKGKYPSISILIPILGNRDIHKTIESIIAQKYSRCEIYILHNGIQSLPEGRDFVERTVCNYDDILIRDLYIRGSGKGNALNEGIRYTNSDLVCVLDADCILQKDALENAVKHFESEDAVAVGGRLTVKKDDFSFIETINFYEYTKTFQISRRLFDWLNAQCLISGAFGVFAEVHYLILVDMIPIPLVKIWRLSYVFKRKHVASQKRQKYINLLRFVTTWYDIV